MIRNLKTLGLALCAVLALTAVVASAASAQGSYTSSVYPTTATGTSPLGNDTFITEAGTIEAAGHFVATLTGPSSHLTITTTYTNAKFAAFNAVIDPNGCTYTLETPTRVSTDNYTAPLQIVCPAGKTIVITVPAGGATCELTVGPQTPTGGKIAITDDTAAGDVTVKADLTNNINYTVTKDGFGCPFAGTGPKTGGSYISHNPITFDAVSPAAASIQVSG